MKQAPCESSYENDEFSLSFFRLLYDFGHKTWELFVLKLSGEGNVFSYVGLVMGEM